MSTAATTIVKNTFTKVFNNLAKELGEAPENIQLGIFYEGGKQKYEVYRKMKREKEFEIGRYVGMVMDFTGGTIIIESTISGAGNRFAKELNVPVDAVKIIMAYKPQALPNAVLMAEGKKIRGIDIEKEFLN